MATNSQRPEGRDGVPSTLDGGIETLNFAKETSGIAPAKTAFDSVGVLLKTINGRLLLSYATTGLWFTFDHESTVSQQDYIELGLNCAEICKALDRGTKAKRTEDLSQPVREAINQLTT